MKWLGLIGILLWVVACSSTDKEGPDLPEYQKVEYIPTKVETQAEFLRRMALERYRLLRLEYLKNPDKYKKAQVIKDNQASDYLQKPKTLTTETIKPKVEPIKKKEEEAPEILAKRKEDREVEIMQNIDFYCIKKREDSETEELSECKTFGMSLLTECENEVENGFYRKDRDLVICLKNKLKQNL